jgi:hypothetical protein
MSVFKTILALWHNSINNFDVGELEFNFKVATYLNNIVQLEHDLGDATDQSGNVIEKKKVDEKNTN